MCQAENLEVSPLSLNNIPLQWCCYNANFTDKETFSQVKQMDSVTCLSDNRSRTHMQVCIFCLMEIRCSMWSGLDVSNKLVEIAFSCTHRAIYTVFCTAFSSSLKISDVSWCRLLGREVIIPCT